MSIIIEEELKHLHIPVQELSDATNGFSDVNLLGRGGFGKVYKGFSAKHGNITIKKLDPWFGPLGQQHAQGDREYKTEIALLSRYKHENIVSLLGFCDQDGQKMLVYKYESNTSLDKHLSNKDLTWIQRLRICIDAARGLQYLHDDVGDQHRILHRDVKSSNILLDDNFKAKVSDFGLSRIGPANRPATFLISNVCGTTGYIDPDYLITGYLTQKSDVYSFGVVLFEVLCGRLTHVPEYNDERQFLSTLVKIHWGKEASLHNIIFPDLKSSINKAALDTFSSIAYQCLQSGHERPTMKKIVEQLENALDKQLSGHVDFAGRLQEQSLRFRSEVELGKFLGSADIIRDAFQAISETNMTYELHTTRSGIKVWLSTGPLMTQLHFLKSRSVYFATERLSDDLRELEEKHINTPLIITGSSWGGHLAILSMLRLNHAIDVAESNGSKNTKRPLCITYGSPLVGDKFLQRAIAERPQWNSFLNVVAKKDPVASFFASKTPYKPFGTFLFCTESGGHTAFDDEYTILLVLDAMKSSSYMNVLGSIRRKKMLRGASHEFNMNLFRAGITLQLREVGVLDDVSNDQIGEMEMEKKQIFMMERKSLKNVVDPVTKLNEMKISLTFMEWYMKVSRATNGYYDSYKYPKTRVDFEKKQAVLSHHIMLNGYWKRFIEETNIMPQKKGSKLRKRWLFGGTNYRRIVEPLDIAEYYTKGNRNYIANRSNHYILLEKWFDEDKKQERRNKAASLTEDSCFWAHVEEALISLRNLLNGGSADVEKELAELRYFEAYVMGEINDYSLSPDVFVDGSSLMKWWNEYKRYKGNAFASEFAKYMYNKSYTNYH